MQEQKEIEIYKNDIELELQLQLEALNITEPDKMPHSKYNYILSKIGKKLFYDRQLKENNGLCNPHYYNTQLLESIYNIYIDLCYIYNKVPSIEGYSLLCNIDYKVIQNWKYEKTNTPQNGIYTKIAQNREAALKNKCIDSNNIIGTITIGNSENGWNTGAQVQHITNNIITADALPILKTTQKSILTKNE